MNVSVLWPLATLSAIPPLFWLAPIAGVAALLMARVFSASVMRRSEGDSEMVRIAQAVRDGAIAYLVRQYRVVAYVFVTLILFLGLLALLGLQPKLTMIGVPLAGFLSGLTAFGMGASTQALFARVGGGIYTKAADVGADLVGKVEAGIPEDDPAIPPPSRTTSATTSATSPAWAPTSTNPTRLDPRHPRARRRRLSVLGLTTPAAALALKLAAAPIALAGLGILCSILGIFAVRTREDASFAQLLKSLHTGVYVASALITAGSLGLLYLLFGSGESAAALTSAGTSWWQLGLSITFGLGAGLVIAYATEYYTSYEKPPTQGIAHQALTGPATVIIAGVAEGMKSTWASLLTTAVAILGAFLFAGGADSFLMGLYGIGIAAVGMLSTLGITLATDAYGPIADNAGGNAEMSGLPPEVRRRTDALDSLGNTTAATGKGFAIGSAALTALALSPPTCRSCRRRSPRRPWPSARPTPVNNPPRSPSTKATASSRSPSPRPSPTAVITTTARSSSRRTNSRARLSAPCPSARSCRS
jgi:Na+/H+-translocating membrane pyrophosphatase